MVYKNNKHGLLFILMMSLGTSLFGQELGGLYKGKRMRPPIVERRDTAGVIPFDLAKHVELLCYNNRMAWWADAFVGPSPLIFNGRLMVPADSILSRVILGDSLKREWRAALYEDQLCAERMVAGCYEPRHLLVFYDEYNLVVGAVEICVTCSGGYSSNGLRDIVFCPDRMTVLSYLVRISNL